MMISFLFALVELLFSRSFSAFSTVQIYTYLSLRFACRNRCLILLKSSWQEAFTLALSCFLRAILSE